MPIRLIRRRIDHAPLYLWVLVALLIAGILIPFHFVAVGTAHARLNTSVSDLMAATMGIGSAIALVAAASGTVRFRPHADLRDSYEIQAWAMVPIVIALLVFDVGIVLTKEDLQFSVVLTALAIGLAWTGVNFRAQARRLTAELTRRVTTGVGDD